MRHVAVLLWVGLAACGGSEGEDEIDSDVRCDRGVALGSASFTSVRGDVVGEQLLVTGSTPQNTNNILIVDLASQQLVSQWEWSISGRIVGPPTTPALLWSRTGTGSGYQPFDMATGALGAATMISEAEQIQDVRTFGAETHVLFTYEYVVIAASGDVLRRPALASPQEASPSTEWRVLVEDGIVGVGMSPADDQLRVLRWDLAGNLVGERTHVLSQLGEYTKRPLGRLGKTAALTLGTGDDTRLWPINPDLSLGDAVLATGASSDAYLVPQGDGATYVTSIRGDHELTVSGLHVAVDTTPTALEVSCTHPFVAPNTGATAPVGAARPTWIWHVGNDLWLHAE